MAVRLVPSWLQGQSAFAIQQGQFFLSKCNPPSDAASPGISLVFVRGFHHKPVLMKACAQVGNGVQAITGDPVHTIQASVLPVLVFFVRNFGYTISSAS